MPLYDYKCTKCKGDLVVLRTSDNYRVMPTQDEWKDAQPSAETTEERPVSSCDHDWERHIQGGNFQLAGRGWARDGYR